MTKSDKKYYRCLFSAIDFRAFSSTWLKCAKYRLWRHGNGAVLFGDTLQPVDYNPITPVMIGEQWSFCVYYVISVMFRAFHFYMT